MRRCADQEIDPVGIPTLSYILGLGPMLPILAAGVGALSFGDPLRSVAIVGGTFWSATILIFIAGVRRGYGFAKTAQPSRSAISGTMAIFGLGLAAPLVFLISPISGEVVLGLGFVAVAVIDPYAARHGDAPRHFMRLRPLQMTLGLAGITMIGLACLTAK